VINSNDDRISHRFRDMASFPLKNAHFSYLLHSTPNLNMFSLNCIQLILFAESLDKRLIMRLKSFSLQPTV